MSIFNWSWRTRQRKCYGSEKELAYIFAIKDVTFPPLNEPSFHLPLGDDKHRLEQLSVEQIETGSLRRWYKFQAAWRVGHTSAGHVNYVGGGGLGLECDKLNPEVVKFQFNQWFGEAFRC